MYYLYIKQHSITGLKYLGYTSSKDPYKYKGSGKYWLRHLSKHGKYITTTILLATKDLADIKDTGIYFSKLFNVAKSLEWANLKEESGDGGWDYVNTHITPKRTEYHKQQGTRFAIINKGKATVKDTEGNVYKIDVNDSKLIEGTLVGHTKGTTFLYDNSGVLHKVDTAKKLPEGLHGNNYGKIFITNGTQNKMISPGTDIPNGWKIGISDNKNRHNKGKIWVTNGILEKMINKDADIPEGWVRGRS